MVIRSALFNIAFWASTLFLGIVCLPLEIAYRPFTFITARLWQRTIFGLLRLLCGITYEVRGRENIPQGAALIVSKHQSAWDTVIFWALLEKPVYILKRELIYIPVFGWQLLLLKSIYIDRGAGSAALKKMMREARARTEENFTVILFPEGTRTIPGAPPHYQTGVSALYQHLNLPVVPVALNSGVYWARNAFTKKPGVIVIEFLPPIQPGMKSRDFLPLVESRIEAASNALLPASRC